MKPTMPMNAYPPGGPPGTPPGGTPPGGGWGPPPGGGGGWGPGTPPPGGFPPPQQPPQKSRTGLYVGVGCGCLLLLACGIGGAILAAGGGLASLMGPGEEVVSTPVTPGQPFTLTYVQSGSQKYKAWLEVDLDFTAGYSLSGNILLSENNQPFGQYTVVEDGEGSPVQERNESVRVGWTSTSLNGNGSVDGTVGLFPIPARADGSTVTLSGTLNAPPGTTGSIRLIVAKRD